MPKISHSHEALADIIIGQAAKLRVMIAKYQQKKADSKQIQFYIDIANSLEAAFFFIKQNDSIQMENSRLKFHLDCLTKELALKDELIDEIAVVKRLQATGRVSEIFEAASKFSTSYLNLKNSENN